MEITKKSRAELKSYFIKHAIPTEADFAAFIDAVLVQKSDGVVKLPGDPLSLEAVGDGTSRKRALSFHRSFADEGPSWTVELNPWGAPNDPASASAGLGFSDAGGVSRLFVSSLSGNVGVGTVAPAQALHVRASAATLLLESSSAVSTLRLQTSEGASNRVDVVNRSGGRLAFDTGAGEAMTVARDGKVGIGVTAPTRRLHVGGTGQIEVGSGMVEPAVVSGIFWHDGDNYGIHRSAGAWNAPNYQQLVIDWPTGIVLSAGPTEGSYTRSYVDVRNSKGLRVSHGSLSVGPADPGSVPFMASVSATDYVSAQFEGTGMGELRLWGWGSGYNIEALATGKHLYLNRNATATSNVYIGRNGSELQVRANGNVGVGGDPGTSKLKVLMSTADYMHVQSEPAGQGELRINGWASGWNINAITKHLYLNRDSGNSSNVYVGRNGAELQVLANGDVGVGGAPAAKLHVFGETRLDGILRANGGIRLDNEVSSHIEQDGALYRYGGQVYVTVDDNLYFRTTSGTIKFWFDLANGVLRQEDWIAPTLTSGWVNYGGYNDAGFFKDRMGIVHLRGLVRAGTTGNDATIFTLPAGYRPAARELHVVQSLDAVGRVDITTDGRVIPYGVSPGWVSLDGITFRTP